MDGARRWGLAAALLVALALDGATWSQRFARGDFESSMLLLYPERAVGRELMLSLVDVKQVEDDRYLVGEGTLRVVVIGEPTGLRVGDELYVRGRFTEPGVMHETWRELAPQRGNKKLLGLIALALTGVVLLLGTRLTRNGLVLRG